MALSLFTQSLTIDPQPVKAVFVSREAEWNISRIHAEDAYEDSKKLPRIRVALLDSGLDTDRDIPFVERKDFLGEEELSVGATNSDNAVTEISSTGEELDVVAPGDQILSIEECEKDHI